MRALHRDQITGSLLLIFAVAWSVTVYQTVSTGFGEIVGPRAFPLSLGIALAVLSGLLVISGTRKARANAREKLEDDEPMRDATRTDVRMIVSVFAIITAYGFLMEKVGFVIATPLIVVAMMGLVLGIRRPVIIAGMAFGITFGCWLVFGKILGAYLPPGNWISLV